MLPCRLAPHRGLVCVDEVAPALLRHQHWQRRRRSPPVGRERVLLAVQDGSLLRARRTSGGGSSGGGGRGEAEGSAACKAAAAAGWCPRPPPRHGSPPGQRRRRSAWCRSRGWGHPGRGRRRPRGPAAGLWRRRRRRRPAARPGSRPRAGSLPSFQTTATCAGARARGRPGAGRSGGAARARRAPGSPAAPGGCAPAVPQRTWAGQTSWCPRVSSRADASMPWPFRFASPAAGGLAPTTAAQRAGTAASPETARSRRADMLAP